MKKSIYLLVILVALFLTGCGPKEQMTNFIPTQVPLEDTEVVIEGGNQGDSETGNKATPTPREIHVGKTTPKYVKLDEYGAFLNIRPSASTKSEPVGFLVHGEKIEVIDIVDGWASFVYENAVCYVNSDFLVDKQPDYLQPPTPTPTPIVTSTPVPEQATPEI